METTAFLDPVRSPPASRDKRRIGGAANRYADQADTDFPSTDGGLRGVQPPLGRERKAAFLGDGNEIAQVP